MTADEMDRIVASLPEWERMPPPALRVRDEVVRLAFRHAAEGRLYRERMDRRLAAIRRTERVLAVLAVCLAAGLAVAGVVSAYVTEARQETFLPEKP